MLDDTKAISAIATSVAAAGTSTITVATYTTAAPGILGAIGLTTTATVAVPVGGVLAVGGLLAYGAVKVKKAMK